MDKLKTGKAIAPEKGKLGVLIPGQGAVTTTLLAGIFTERKGGSKYVGSLTQTGKIRLGKRSENRLVPISEFVPLTSPDDLVFGCWDIFPDDAYEAAKTAEVLKIEDIDYVKEELKSIKPMKAVFDKKYVKRLDGPHVKSGSNKMELAKKLMDDIEQFKSDNGLERVVVCWAASTEAYTPISEVHSSLERFEKGLEDNNPSITPSQIYAYASLKKGVPYINGAPHISSDSPALMELAQINRIPVAGKDFKTGQTLMKTIIAPGLQARMLGISGWFSTNILGNRDGEVLDDPDSFRSKEISKLGVLDTILKPEDYPELYKNLHHKIRINYYPPRRDNKESWDNIDIFGWMNYPMEMKLNFLCRDSILAAPVMLDLIIFADLAKRAGMYGIMEWLSFYFKSPMVKEGIYPENDLFIQRSKLENTLRYIMEEELIHHTGLDYYYEV